MFRDLEVSETIAEISIDMPQGALVQEEHLAAGIINAISEVSATVATGAVTFALATYAALTGELFNKNKKSSDD